MCWERCPYELKVVRSSIFFWREAEFSVPEVSGESYSLLRAATLASLIGSSQVRQSLSLAGCQTFFTDLI